LQAVREGKNSIYLALHLADFKRKRKRERDYWHITRTSHQGVEKEIKE